MPYVLQNDLDDDQYVEDQQVDPSLIPPEAAAVQGVTSVIAATLRAIGSQRQTGENCTPCAKKKRAQQLARLRMRVR